MNWPRLSRVTYFITHRCNLACTYCATILKENRTDEMSAEDTLKAVDKMCDLEPELVVITGGEPTVRRDLQAVINRLNERGMYHVVITNGTPPRILDLKGLKGVSCSIDETEALIQIETGHKPYLPTEMTDQMVKSLAGVDILLQAKQMGADVTASIVAGRHNADKVPHIVKGLTELGIASYICVLHAGEEEFWRFRSKDPSMIMTQNQAADLSFKLSDMKNSGDYKILNDMSYLQKINDFGASLDWHCSKPVDLVVDSNGSIMTCSDFWGPECKAMNILNFNLDVWREGWMRDQQKCAPGCFWQCVYQAETPSSSRTPGLRVL